MFSNAALMHFVCVAPYERPDPLLASVIYLLEGSLVRRSQNKRKLNNGVCRWMLGRRTIFVFIGLETKIYNAPKEMMRLLGHLKQRYA